jgi:hypothetical protein
MDKTIGGVLSGLLAMIFGSTVLLWRKVEGKVNYKSCNDKHNHQVIINTDLIDRLARVETKIDMGFKNISNKIESNGKNK